MKDVTAWLIAPTSHYNSCPKGNNYNTCTHNDLKTSFDQGEVRPREKRKAELPGEIYRLEEEMAELRREIDDSRSTRREYAARLTQEESELAEQNRLHNLAQAALNDEHNKLNSELYISKADIYLASSQQGSTSVQSAIGSLE